MKTSIKILITVSILLMGGLISALISNGKSGAAAPVIIFAGVYFGIREIWKEKSKKSEENNN